MRDKDRCICCIQYATQTPASISVSSTRVHMHMQWVTDPQQHPDHKSWHFLMPLIYLPKFRQEGWISHFSYHIKTACKQPCWSKQTKNNTTVSVWGWNEMTHSRLIPTLNKHQFFHHLEIPLKGDFRSLKHETDFILWVILSEISGEQCLIDTRLNNMRWKNLLVANRSVLLGETHTHCFCFETLHHWIFFIRQTAQLCFHCAKTNPHITIGYLLTVWCTEMWCEICMCSAKCNPVFGVQTTHLRTFGRAQSLNYRSYYSVLFDGRNLLRFVGIETLKHIICYKTISCCSQRPEVRLKGCLGCMKIRTWVGWCLPLC